MPKDILYSGQQVLELLNEALDGADQALWLEIKGRPDSRDRLLATADALEVIRDEIYRLIQEALFDGDIAAA